MKYLYILFCWFAIFAFLPNESLQDALEDVRRMTTEFSALNGPATDVLEAVELISKKSATFLKLVGPVGSLLAAAVETAFPPESSEYKAIAMLHSRMTENFATTLEAIEQLGTSFDYSQTMIDYGNFVVTNKDNINPLFLRVSDPDPNVREKWKEEFNETCKDSRSSPLNTLRWMNRRLNIWCPLPQKEEAQIYALLVDLFSEIESKVESGFHFGEQQRHFQYEALKFEIIAYMTTKSIKRATKKIEKIRSMVLPDNNVTFANFDELKAKLNQAMRPAHIKFLDDPFDCILKAVIEGEKYQRDALLNVIDIVRRDYIQLQMIAGLCANISTNGDESKMATLIDEANSLVVDMSDKINLWTIQKLELAWPETMIAYAKTAYPKNVDRLDKEYRYNRTAIHAWRNVNARGPRKYIHTVLITPDWDTQDMFWAPCATSYHCVKAPNFKGTQLVVTRYEKMDIERAMRAKAWFDRQRPNISAIIEQNWKTDSLPALINTINKEIGGGIGDPTLFLNFVFVRNSVWTRDVDECPIDEGFSYAWVHKPELLPLQSIDIFVWPCDIFCFFENLEHFHLNLLL